jgi:hypothetical protein
VVEGEGRRWRPPEVDGGWGTVPLLQIGGNLGVRGCASAEGFSRRLTGAGAGPGAWPLGRGRGTVSLLWIGGDLGRDSCKRRGLLADVDGGGGTYCGLAGAGGGMVMPRVDALVVVLRSSIDFILFLFTSRGLTSP